MASRIALLLLLLLPAGIALGAEGGARATQSKGARSPASSTTRPSSSAPSAGSRYERSPAEAAPSALANPSAPPLPTPVPLPTGTVYGITSCDDRPATLYAPVRARLGGKVPLVVALHGYSSSGNGIDRYLELRSVADRRGFVLLQPNGKPDGDGRRFWNATPGCCDFMSVGVDDSSYLRCLIDAVVDRIPVDARRIFLIGYDNGGFMAHRMACDHADRVAAIVSFAGATYADASRCKPSDPVSVLQIHGSSDVVIRYGGGIFTGPYPGARTTVQRWASLNECRGSATTGVRRLDLEAELPGADTTMTSYSGCPAGGAVELWTMEGADHRPELSDGFAATAIDWLLAHPKPD